MVDSGQWAFVPGQPSAGSTAPLWTALLAVGYAAGLPFRLWAYALGVLCLAGTALAGMQLAEVLWSPQKLAGDRPGTGQAAWILGLGLAVEWHLVWAALSGMETLLFTLLALLLWTRTARDPLRRPLLTGLLAGALILARPEGILAAILAGLGTLLAAGLDCQWRRGIKAGALLAGGAALLVVPYLAFNLRLSGNVWPNTLYAKQAEYAVLLAQPLLVRLGRVALAPLVGGQILLLPALIWAAGCAARQVWRAVFHSPFADQKERPGPESRAVGRVLPLVWAIATVGVYALRLPVTYQHGRYLIPVIPLLLVYGFGGLLHVRQRCAGGRGPGLRTARVLSKAWFVSTIVLFAAFSFLGARAYAADVAIIEEEMVAAAHWLDEHTRPDAVIAAHDIGAVGFFAQRPLLDLAGLVNPEVVPFVRDEQRLLAWMAEQSADYLVAFPSWYPLLVADSQVVEVHCTDAAVTVEQGGENICVYTLRFSGQ